MTQWNKKNYIFSQIKNTQKARTRVTPIRLKCVELKQTVVLTPTVYKQEEQAIRHSSQIESSNVPLIAGLLDNGQFGSVGRKVASLSLKIWPTKR